MYMIIHMSSFIHRYTRDPFFQRFFLDRRIVFFGSPEADFFRIRSHPRRPNSVVQTISKIWKRRLTLRWMICMVWCRGTWQKSTLAVGSCCGGGWFFSRCWNPRCGVYGYMCFDWTMCCFQTGFPSISLHLQVTLDIVRWLSTPHMEVVYTLSTLSPKLSNCPWK